MKSSFLFFLPVGPVQKSDSLDQPFIVSCQSVFPSVQVLLIQRLLESGWVAAEQRCRCSEWVGVVMLVSVVGNSAVVRQADPAHITQDLLIKIRSFFTNNTAHPERGSTQGVCLVRGVVKTLYTLIINKVWGLDHYDLNLPVKGHAVLFVINLLCINKIWLIGWLIHRLTHWPSVA